MSTTSDQSAGRPCPACGDAAPETLWRQDFALIEGVSVLRGYDVVACTVCGMTYADGIPGQQALDQYYRDASKYEFHQRGGAESACDAARLVITADAIATQVPVRGARVLDVGCATGRLLAELRTRGFTNLRGIDPSPSCVATARERYGVRADTATIAELGPADAGVDLIILVGVLEHLVNLDAALAALGACLATNGLVYVEVPDVTGFADWPNAPFQEFSVEHVNFFSPASLTRAMHERGFAAEWIERNTRDQSSGMTVANLAGLFRIGGATRATPAAASGIAPGAGPATASPADQDSRASVLRYVARCAEDEREVHRRIDLLVGSQTPVIVWGVGTQTLRLLGTSALVRANIVAFVDSNMRYQGRRVCGRVVLAPSEVRSRAEPILVVSRGFDSEIRDQIRTELGLSNRTISLQEDQFSC